MKYLCLLFACMILMGCPAARNNEPSFYLVIDKIPHSNTVKVWTEKKVYEIVLPPEEYKQVYVGQTGLVPVVWVEGER